MSSPAHDLSKQPRPGRGTPGDTILTVRDLGVRIGGRSIVRDVSFDVTRGSTLGIVGESGSGKSLTVLAATGLLDAPAARAVGSSRLGDVDLVGASPRTLRGVHGARIGFVFQDPSTSLHPLLTVERQITETLEQHTGLGRRQAAHRAVDLLESVGIPDPAARARAYPHQLSGGQRQRVMIAIALACEPELLVADEPTTALDVTTQKQIVELVQDLQERTGTAVVWISHDLGVIGRVADEIAVLRDGDVMERSPAPQLFTTPQQEYTRILLAARPTRGGSGPPEPREEATLLLDVEHLHVRFPGRAGAEDLHAVDDVSFTLRRGRTLGIVGESGSGKSTIAGALTGLVPVHDGKAVLHSREQTFDLTNPPRAQRRQVARHLTMVFQDPFSSLDPRSTVAASITEPLRVHRLASGDRRSRVQDLLELVGLGTGFADRRPHELSGGQRQRVSIARALAVEPDVLILDEATSALDVSIQSSVLDLLGQLQQDLGLAYLFIAHDLAIVERMSHDVLVLQNGRTQEYRPAGDLFGAPESDYTRRLLAAIPPAAPKAQQPDW